MGKTSGSLFGVIKRAAVCVLPRALGLALALALLLTLALASFVPPAAAAERGGDGAGKPLVHNYHPRAYAAEPQTWDVLQGDSGIMYFANNAGVLEYDGRTWRLIELPSRLDVRWLAKDPRGPSSPFAGRIYVGATGDFGYLAPDTSGQLQFRSLLPAEAREDKTFDHIFSPAVTPEGIVFQARNRICRWDDVKLTCRETELSLSRIFGVNGRSYVQKKHGGLMQMTGDGDTLRPVPGGERFTQSEITMLLPYGSGRDESLLVGTRDFQLFVQSGGAFVPFAAATREGHANEVLLRGAALPDGTFALATQYRGVLIVDRDGRVMRTIDQSAGLQANHVLSMLQDRDGGLWLGLQSGISRVDVGSPFSIFDEDFGLEREWRDILNHRGTLYVRGYKGLFAAEPPAPGTAPRFRRVQDLEPPVWSMVVAGDGVLATSRDSLYELHGTTARRIVTLPSMPVTIYKSRTDPRRIYVGLVEGVTSLRLTDGKWIDEGRVAGIDETITSMGEGRSGALWMVSQRQRILRAEFTNTREQAANCWALATPAPQKGAQRTTGRCEVNIRVYSLGRGALTGRVVAREVTGRLVFLTEDGIFEFDSATETFVQSPAFAALTAAGRRSFSWIAEDSRGDVWVASRKPGAVDVLRRQWDGRYVADTSSPLQMPAWAVYPEPDGRIVWLSVPDYLLRYDLSIQSRPAESTTLIRKVTVNDDTLVYGGAPSPPGDPAAATTKLEFPYRSNSLHFEYAAPRFDDAERSEFQSYLEGFDRHWSAWSREPGRSYTNLPAGDYHFHVRARDARGVIGRDAVFGFTVLRPWYRSTPAYVTYALFLLGAVIGLWKVQLGRAHRAMQRDVEHRELEKLRELDRMKSRFFTDISHEFRTPLTLILAPVGQMLQDLDSKTSRDARPRLLMVRRHAEYLLRLISQLLDLSKVESGTMRLQAAECDLGRTIEPLVFAFAAAAEQQGIDLRWEDCSERIALYLDREVIEKIVNNLLANALKFTPRGGAITVRIGHAIGSVGPDGAAEIVVSDTGAGIARDQLPHIFNRFYQSDAGRSREGIGVGLALVKELVELQGGTIGVDSAEGAGTIFVVRIPKGRAHLTDDQILHVSEAAPVLAPPLPAAAAAAAAAPTAAVVMAAPASTAPTSLADAVVADALVADAVDDERTVLIVEDHAEVRAFLRDHLQPHYHVLEAKDGAEGMTVAVAELPDLVLSDVMMGPVNGYELCKALKTNEKTCHIPIVLLTARAGREDKLLGLDIGADCYLIKPFDPSELLVQVRNLIDQRRMLRERFSSSVVLKPSEMAVMPMDEAFLTRVLSVVERHLSDPEFDVERLGREVGLSRSQLHRKIRALTNQPPTLLIRSIRLQRAAELLRQEAGSVAEVAYLVGFSSQGYFAKCFREQFGCAPRDYAEKVLQQ
jgi:signal transduction histidine kinase/DNA-binding response OmpR family regulator